MRIGLTLWVGERAFDVLVEGPEGIALEEVAERLCAIGGVRRGTPLWCAGVPLDPAAPVGLPPLLHGAVLSAGGPDAAGGSDHPTGAPALAVVCGPNAGMVRPLCRGSIRLGRGAGVELRLDDPEVSRAHAELTVDQDAVAVADLDSANGTTVSGRAVGSTAVRVGEGDLLRVGETVLMLVGPLSGRACVRPDGAGRLAVNTPPSIAGPQRRAHVEFPTEPAAPQPARLHAIALLVPLVIAVPAALWWGPTMLLFLVLSPVLMLANYLGDRASGRRTGRRNEAAYRLDLEAAEVRLAEALYAEARARRAEALDPASVTLTAEGRGPRLWECRRDAGALTLRLGLAGLPARTTVTGATGRSAAPVVTDVPVTVDLQACGSLGVAGPRPRVLDVVRAMVLQIAVTHGPRDVRLAVLCGTDEDAEWGWTRWLPHVGPAGDGGAGWADLGGRVADLVRLLDVRRIAARRGGAEPQRPEPLVVLVLDDARALRELPGVARLLLEGPTHGVHAICLTDGACALPAECGATAVLHGETGTRLEVRVAGAHVVPNALADLVGAAHAEAVARALAPLRDATPPGADAALPDRVRLVDLLGLPDPAGPSEELGDALADRWTSTPGSMRALIGTGPVGPVAVDLGRDGPHGLVAGTTGAGKSELLQTLVASLAVANRPDELAFLLVDYKGGAAFAECAGLPHTVGMVTDLDPHLTARALRSMEAELRGREQFLAAAGCADLAAYEESGRSQGPLCRLLIVVDEFAALAAELPEFVSGLVDIARRGRSLGVHLLLATQRPAGVVTAEIRANTALRIALRVTDPEESRDVVDCADAAAIPTGVPGRAYLRTAEGPAVPFQTARVGGPAPGPRRAGVTVIPWSWGTAPAAEPDLDGRSATSDLAALAAAARRAADLLDVTPPPSPWLPALPELLSEAALADAPDPAGAAACATTLAIGLLDLPARQSYATLGLDLAGGGHWAFVGGPRTGRSTALRTLAGEAARRAGEVHIYGLDFGGGGLRPIAALDCCGAVAGRDDVDRTARLIDRLSAEVTRRQDLLAESGLGSVAEQRGTFNDLDPLPWMLVLVDGWDNLAAALADLDPVAGADRLLRLLQDGPAAGLHVALTGGRDLLTGRVASLVTHRAVLALPDRLDYGLAGIAPREVPDRMPPGRALIPTAQGVLEAQLAFPDAGAEHVDQATPPAAVGAEVTRRGNSGPLRVEELPARLPWTVARDAALLQRAPTAGRLWTLVGLGGDDLRPLALDPQEDGAVLVVAGPARSGRSTALGAIARWHGEQGVPVIAIAPRRSPLRAAAGSPDGPEGSWLTDGADPQVLQSLIAAARRPGSRRAPGPLVILVDTVEQVADTAAGDLLAELVSGPEESNLLVVVAGTAETFASAYRGLGAAARKSRCVLLLGRCGAAEAELAGTPLPRTAAGPPGRGLLAVRGEVGPIQVPLP